MAALVVHVGAHGTYLATRSTGRELRQELEEAISTSDTSAAVIDFAGVEAMTISCVDEFLGRFLTALAADQQRPVGVVLEGLNEETREAIAICLERRDTAVVESGRDSPQLLGAAQFLADTYRTAAQLGTFSAAELARALKISPQNANNRLKRLVGCGALLRIRASSAQRGGKEYTYTLPETLSAARA